MADARGETGAAHGAGRDAAGEHAPAGGSAHAARATRPVHHSLVRSTTTRLLVRAPWSSPARAAALPATAVRRRPSH